MDDGRVNYIINVPIKCQEFFVFPDLLKKSLWLYPLGIETSRGGGRGALRKSLILWGFFPSLRSLPPVVLYTHGQTEGSSR